MMANSMCASSRHYRMPAIDQTSQRLTSLVAKAAADQRIGFFERRSIKSALSDAIDQAVTPAQVDEYRAIVHHGIGFASWGGSDFPSSRAYRSLEKQGDEKKLELSAGSMTASIEALAVSPELKAAMTAIALNGVATPDQQDKVEHAYLADLSRCTTPEAVGELYWSTYDVLKSYRRTGGGHDAWWCTGADQKMREKSAEKQMALDPRIKLNAYNDAPVRTVDWR